MYWDEVSFLETSKLAYKIMDILHIHTQPLTPTQIAKLTHIARSNVSTKLIHLKHKGLVECITPKRRKGRFYSLTPKGKKVVQIVKSRLVKGGRRSLSPQEIL